jgi:DNA-binding SARP family transcriptional activator
MLSLLIFPVTTSPKAVSQLKRDFQSLLEVDPFPTDMEFPMLQLLEDFGKSLKATINEAFADNKITRIKRDVQALFDEDPIDANKLSDAKKDWKQLVRITERLHGFFEHGSQK